MLYGWMTEEINFSYDGGLYAELLRDRTIGPGRRPLFHWTEVARGASVVGILTLLFEGEGRVALFGRLGRARKGQGQRDGEGAERGVLHDGSPVAFYVVRDRPKKQVWTAAVVR